MGSTPASRIPDICTGHGCFPPRASCNGSPNVFANTLPAKRVGCDCYVPHGCPVCPPHGAVQAAGCGTIFVNTCCWAGIGHAVSCGGVVAVGSGNVFVCL